MILGGGVGGFGGVKLGVDMKNIVLYTCTKFLKINTFIFHKIIIAFISLQTSYKHNNVLFYKVITIIQ